MKAFPDKLRFDDAGMLNGDRVFVLTHEFRYVSSMGVIHVPALFLTDGASIPKAFHSVLGPFGSYFEAAVIHDFLYSPENLEFDRRESDEIFYEAMYKSGVPWATRAIIYRAVRIFGKRHFKGRPMLGAIEMWTGHKKDKP